MVSGYFFAALLIMLAIQNYFGGVHVENIPYSDFKALLKAGKVSEVAIRDDAIVGTLKNEGLEQVLPKETVDALAKLGQGEHKFVTVRVSDPTLIQELEAAKVRFAGQVESKWLSTLLSWILPAVIFVGLWSLIMKRMGAAGGFMEIGKSKAKVYMEKETGVTFADVAGIDEAKAELMEVVEFLKNPQRYQRLGGKIPKGVLLVGAPGTGKTLLAKAVAGEAGVPFFTMSGSDFVEMFVGVGAARVRDLFAQAEQKAPCVIIMAATTRPEILDPALLRPGRFDRHVALDRPDLKGREQILRVHAKQVTLAPEVDLAVVAARTPGFAGADLANLVNEAALLAARKGKDAVEMVDFDEALDRIVAGVEKKNRLMNPKEKETVAYHEAGHALVAESRPHADRVSKISIIPRGVAALGYTQQTPREDRYLLTRTELLDRIDVLLGGRVAEELVFDDVSTGAQNDLQRATDMARQMVTQYGMSERLGLATFEQPRTALFLDMPIPHGQREYSEHTARAIDEEVGKLLADAHERVSQTLVTRRSLLESLAKLLLEKEVVDRATLDQLLAGAPGREAVTADLAPVAQPDLTGS